MNNNDNNNTINGDQADSLLSNNNEGEGHNRKELADSSTCYVIIAGLAADATVDDVLDCLKGI
jgi:hypothetical protein